MYVTFPFRNFCVPIGLQALGHGCARVAHCVTARWRNFSHYCRPLRHYDVWLHVLITEKHWQPCRQHTVYRNKRLEFATEQVGKLRYFTAVEGGLKRIPWVAWFAHPCFRVCSNCKLQHTKLLMHGSRHFKNLTLWRNNDKKWLRSRYEILLSYSFVEERIKHQLWFIQNSNYLQPPSIILQHGVYSHWFPKRCQVTFCCIDINKGYVTHDILVHYW